jgi:CheY-like chemotaxis protein
MTHQILGFARGETAAMSSVNLSDVVAAGLNLLRAVVPENIELVSKALARDLWVIGDDSQISQLVLNLAVNARDALPEGGKIEISAERLELTQPKTLLHSDGKPAGKLDAGHYAKLVIRDNGTGIPESVRHRIFEPFFTTKSRRGTGLGLANVVSIVKAHSGVITVRSDEGKGTQFSVYLPALKGVPEESAQSSNQAGRPVPVGRERILVVDDEEAVRTVMQRCLEHLGYEVEVAASGAEAIARYAEDIKRFRLVILDMMMPQMSGDEVFLKLQTLNSEVGVLIASGYSSDVRTRRVLDSGGLGFIQKPFAVDDLAREVRRCLDSL